jgi:hypothetical protein
MVRLRPADLASSGATPRAGPAVVIEPSGGPRCAEAAVARRAAAAVRLDFTGRRHG